MSMTLDTNEVSVFEKERVASLIKQCKEAGLKGVEVFDNEIDVETLVRIHRARPSQWLPLGFHDMICQAMPEYRVPIFLRDVREYFNVSETDETLNEEFSKNAVVVIKKRFGWWNRKRYRYLKLLKMLLVMVNSLEFLKTMSDLKISMIGESEGQP